MNSEEVLFSNQTIKLAGTLYLPESKPPYPAVVAIHPASEGERTSFFYDHLKTELPAHGMSVLVFDRRGSGTSEGDFETSDFEDLAGDVIAAVEYLQARPDIDGNKIGLHGTSQGAWISPIAAARKPDISCVVSVSASGVSPADQMNYGVAFHLLREGFDQSVVDRAIKLRNVVNEYFRGQVSKEEAASKLSRFENKSWYEQAYIFPSQDLPADIMQSKWHYEMDYEPLSIWKEVKQPALFLFAEIDEWVPIEQSVANYQAATRRLSEVMLKRIKGTDHLMRHPNGQISREYLDTLTGWLASHLLMPRSPSGLMKAR